MIKNATIRKDLIKTQQNNTKENQITSLLNNLNSLEKNHNEDVANKYLMGFLEEKGFDNYEGFIKSLDLNQ